MRLKFQECHERLRLPLGRGVRLYEPRSRRYRAGVTIDVSAAGALVEVRGGMRGEVGEWIGMAIDWDAPRGMTGRGEMRPAVVTRLETTGPATQRVAVRFPNGRGAAAA